eukprot:COSAG06_NODE_310_length_17775_cov_9.971374_24_plen_119_part_00
MYVSEWPWLTEVGNFLALLWRFQVLDHPLVMLGDLAYDSGSMATKIAAIVWCATTVVFLLLERFSLSAECIQFTLISGTFRSPLAYPGGETMMAVAFSSSSRTSTKLSLSLTHTVLAQ